MSAAVGIRLGLQERLRLHPPEVVEVVARVASLPDPSAHCLAGRAVERRWHVPVPGTPSSPGPPGVDSWVARHEANTAIALRALQQRPVRILVVDATGDLHPSLAPMLGSDAHLHLQVRAWCEHRNRCVRLIIPLLPHIKTSARGRRAATAHCSPRARLRVVLELRREACWSVVSHVHSHLILAQRARHPAVASGPRGEERQGHSNLPHRCKLRKDRRGLS